MTMHEGEPADCRPLPPPVSALGDLCEAAWDFDCYADYNFDEIAEIAERVLGEHERTGRWNGSVEELRCTMFFLQRAAHHTGSAPRGKALHRFLDLFSTIRARWHEDGGARPKRQSEGGS